MVSLEASILLSSSWGYEAIHHFVSLLFISFVRSLVLWKSHVVMQCLSRDGICLRKRSWLRRFFVCFLFWLNSLLLH